MEQQHRRAATAPRHHLPMHGLHELDCQRNVIKELPSSLGLNQTLKLLDVSRNLLVEIPETITGMCGLETLRLGQNRITRLPETMGKQFISARQNGRLESLKLLSVSYNLLTALPVAMNGLTTLTELDVAQNHLTSLPELGALHESIVRVKINHNLFESLPEITYAASWLVRTDFHPQRVAVQPSEDRVVLSWPPQSPRRLRLAAEAEAALEAEVAAAEAAEVAETMVAETMVGVIESLASAEDSIRREFLTESEAAEAAAAEAAEAAAAEAAEAEAAEAEAAEPQAGE